MKILDEFYPVDFGDFIPIPKDKQPVVAGIFCHSFFIDDKGNCTFDRLNDIQMTSPPMLISSSHKRENKENDISNMQKIDKLIDKNSKNDTDKNSKNDQNNTNNENNEEKEVDMKPECPVCKYMKGGPCKSEFVQWEDCVDSIGETEDMQKCFKVKYYTVIFFYSDSYLNDTLQYISPSHRIVFILSYRIYLLLVPAGEVICV